MLGNSGDHLSINHQLSCSYSDLSTFVEEFGENLRCNFQTGEKILRDDITMFIYEITQVLNNIRARLNPDVVHKVAIHHTSDTVLLS